MVDPRIRWTNVKISPPNINLDIFSHVLLVELNFHKTQ